jgi:hypothetical protein
MDKQMMLQLQFLGIMPMTDNARKAFKTGITFVTKSETRILPRNAYPGDPREYTAFYDGLRQKVDLLKQEEDADKAKALEDRIRADLAKVPGTISYEPK